MLKIKKHNYTFKFVFLVLKNYTLAWELRMWDMVHLLSKKKTDDLNFEEHHIHKF